MISCSISRNRIDNNLLVPSKKGPGHEYLTFTLVKSKTGPDQYDNDGFISQNVSKEQKAQGIKGPIIGNWKDLDRIFGKKPTAATPSSKPATKPAAPPLDDSDSEIPF